MALQSSNYTNGRIVGQPTEGVITEIREAFSKYCAYDKLCIGSLAILNKKKAYSEGLHSGELQCGCWVRKIFSTNEDAKLGNRDFFRTWLDWKNFMINISRPIENIFSEKIFFWNVHWIRKSSKSHLWMSKKEKKLVNYLISTSIHSRM